MFRPDNLFSVLTPIYYTTKLLGLAPFSIANEGFAESKQNLLCSILFMVVLQIYNIITLNNMPTVIIANGIIGDVINVLDAYTSQVGIFSETFFGCVFVKEILKAIEEMNDFDKNIQLGFQIDLNKEYRRSKFYVVLGTFGTLIFASISTSFTAIGTYDENTVDYLGEFVLFTAPGMLNTFVDLQICVLLLCLKQRFHWLNEKILSVSKTLEICFGGSKNLFTSVGPFFMPTITTSFKHENLYCLIEKIRRKHFLLCNISKKLNKAYSVQILLIVLQNFVTLSTSIYYAGKHMIVDTVLPINYIVYTIIQLILSFAQILALVYVCSNTTAEASKMGILIHGMSLLNGGVKNKLKENLQIEITLFSLQLHHKVEFTACKAFVINESLLVSMVGALATYLVIVIQFDTLNFKQPYV